MVESAPVSAERFGRLLRAHRLENGLSLADLASRTYTHRGSIGNIENGKRLPDQRFAELADAVLQAGGLLLAAWSRAVAAQEQNRTHRKLLEHALRDSRSVVEIGGAEDLFADDIGARADDLAVRYLGTSAAEMLEEAVALRRAVTARVNRLRLRPRELSDAYRIVGRLSGVLAYATLDLGDPDAALSHAEAAWRCGDLSQDDNLKAWTRGTQSLILRFMGNESAALKAAMDGQNYASRGEGLSRLLAAEAQSRATMGDSRSANSLLNRGLEEIESGHGNSEVGIFGFTEEKQLYYTGSSLIWLDDGKSAKRAAEASKTAIAMWSNGNYRKRSLSDEALAHVYLAMALFQLGNPEEAIEVIRAILYLPPERQFAWIGRRLSHLIATLDTAPFAASPILADITQEIRSQIAALEWLNTSDLRAAPFPIAGPALEPRDAI